MTLYDIKINRGHLTQYAIIKKNTHLKLSVCHTLTFLLVCDIIMFEAAKLNWTIVGVNALH